jgi:hypothetical protein
MVPTQHRTPESNQAASSAKSEAALEGCRHSFFDVFYKRHKFRRFAALTAELCSAHRFGAGSQDRFDFQ